MCGIFGIIVNPKSTKKGKEVSSMLMRLALYSESRGKDSSGIAFKNYESNKIDVIKGDIPIHQLIKDSQFKQALQNNLVSYAKGNPFVAFGHARLVTMVHNCRW
jgi:glucosamine 6-phosphate synthetase-like amidotransferase/phosphosugar isomerase protein